MSLNRSITIVALVMISQTASTAIGTRSSVAQRLGFSAYGKGKPFMVPKAAAERAVEIIPRALAAKAVRDAVNNAELNGLRNAEFIQEDPPVDRVVAVPSEPQFLCDVYFDMQCARPMPVYSVPGLIDHF